MVLGDLPDLVFVDPPYEHIVEIAPAPNLPEATRRAIWDAAIKVGKAAIREATDFINSNREGAAGIYLKMTGDKSKSAEELGRMLADPQLRFTLTPENVVKFAAFKVRVGTVKIKPDSWKDLFFSDIHDLPGS